MNPLRLLLLVAVVCCFNVSLFADDKDSPFGLSQPYSADMVTTLASGQTITQKIFSDTGKVRTEVTASGMQMVSIIRPDQKKIYSVMVAQKMVMEMPYDPEKYKKMAAASSNPEGKIENVGTETVEGVSCTKYKVTTDKDSKVFYYWIDAANKVPVKMAADDKSVVILWKNFKAGSQDAALFEPPAGFQVMQMPGAPAAAAAPTPPPSGDGQ